MRISIIAAVSENNVIGKDGKLPWKLSGDLKNFKKLTTGHTIVMGRKTHESIGSPLPNRVNIVLSRNKDYAPKDVIVANNFNEAIETAKRMQEDEVFFIGGEFVFNKALKMADRIYLTEVKSEVEGDTYFPEFDKSEWKETSKQSFRKNENNNYDFDIVVYDKEKDKEK